MAAIIHNNINLQKVFPKSSIKGCQDTLWEDGKGVKNGRQIPVK